MFSDKVPRETWGEVNTGVKDDNYSKLVIFDPKAITDINYIYGCHEARPAGRLVWGTETIPLLHYKAIGGIERLLARKHMYEPRRQRSAFNVRWGCGAQYGEPDETTIKWYDQNLKNSAPLFPVGGR